MRKSLLVLLFLSTFFFSCFDAHKGEIVLDNSDPLALATDIQWAVVKDPYAAFRADTSWDSLAVDHCRMGDIFPVKGKKSVINSNKEEVWYLFDAGYLPESVVRIYQNKYKAMNASALLLK
jgi:hypothetical protein